MQQAHHGGRGLAQRVSSWWWAIGVIAFAGLTIRVVYVIVWQNPSSMWTDAAYYHYGANDLVNGWGFPDSLVRHLHGRVEPGAAHPPGPTVFLAAASLVGLQGTLSHQLWSCVLGTSTIVVIALVGRRIGGDRVGLIAGVVAAVYPGLWTNDAYLMPETLAQALAAVALLLAYRALTRPTTGNAIALGVVCGAATLTRGEMILLFPLLLVPVLLRAPGRWKHRAALVAVSAIAMVAVIMPWAVYNSSRLEHPEPISSSTGALLLGANCPVTYEGSRIGTWFFLCSVPRHSAGLDASEIDVKSRDLAVTYALDHVDRLPAVAAARFGRTFGLFNPLSSHEGDIRRETLLAGAMLLMYYALVVLAIVGAVRLLRRHTPVWPLLSLVVISFLVSITTYGNVRFRAIADVSLVLLAAVALSYLASRRAEVRARDGRPTEIDLTATDLDLTAGGDVEGRRGDADRTDEDVVHADRLGRE